MERRHVIIHSRDRGKRKGNKRKWISICKTVKQAKMCGCAESAGSAGMPWNDQNFIFLSQFGI